MKPWSRDAFGLYDPRWEHDACGVGFVADRKGRKSYHILERALEALVNCEHRGAVSADGITGDGAGVMTQLPHSFFEAVLAQHGMELPEAGRYGVGMMFLPRVARELARCKELVESCADEFGLHRIGWRVVPTNLEMLGEKAQATCPHVEQFFIADTQGRAEIELERQLYLLRRRIESRIRRENVGPLYVASLSCRTLVYKGLMVAGQLARFFPDLADPRYTTSIAVFHQRYSTNTHPTWHLAQPFRMLAHNGEINTIQGNVLRMKAREPSMRGGGWNQDELDELSPIIQEGNSDSASLDNVLELLVLSGRSPMHAIAMLVPEAYKNNPDVPGPVRDFYDFHSGLIEPWDGPAALAVTDGRFAVAALDRNGLRPARYWIMDDDMVIVGSEAGLVDIPSEKIVKKGRLGPGKMIAVDTVSQELLTNSRIKQDLASRQPYRDWLKYTLDPGKEGIATVRGNGDSAGSRWSRFDDQEMVRLQKAFGIGTEDLERIFEPMLYDAKEPVGSMGDDTPIAVLSHQPQSLYRYFKQMFAQVTNPPIDPLREKAVMSLDIQIFARGHLLEEDAEANRLLRFSSPIIDDRQMEWLTSEAHAGFRTRTLDCTFDRSAGPEGLDSALEELGHQAEACVNDGVAVIVLSDRQVGPDRVPIPMLLATASIHHRLMRSRIRMRAALICDTGDAREDHHIACLIGFGASLVNPYVSLETVRRIALKDPRKNGISPDQAVLNYRKALDSGLLKILSKMGISTLASYRGAQIFEAIGLGRKLIERHFTSTPSRIGGIGLREIALDALRWHDSAFNEEPVLKDHGVFHYLSRDGEYHAFNPLVFKALHKAVRNNSVDDYAKYSVLVQDRPPTNLRDLLTWKKAVRPLDLAEVEPIESIARRFCTQAMSHGAVSRETHEVLAIAMNRIGGKSNSGEGGEERIRFQPYADGFEPDPTYWFAPWRPQAGDSANSAIKQVASARFGVTPEYLVRAREIEIKMAQGSKPGEGGQIPGFKVSPEIASIRRSPAGVTLISPPPHHDIYSIEDLSQLIHDLKRVNQEARICVKLVSLVGMGTVAAGVAKGFADTIQISGNDGGTGASPLSSIKHAGLPWELGLAETQQVLVMNDLRGRVKLRVDGGMKTGRDVVIAALLGAEEFGFGTAALVAAGCVMARRCHLNNCPVGIASQRPDLRAKFPGTPEHIVNFMMFVAQEVRMILAEMGLKSVDELIGRVDLLEQKRNISWPKAAVDLSAILADPDPTGQKARRCQSERNTRPAQPHRDLDQIIWEDYCSSLPTAKVFERTYDIDNRQRSVGARLSGEIARHWHEEGLPPNTVSLTFQGAAGQSFGAFCNHGMNLTLVGEAQDYVGKGMHGGVIVIKPPKKRAFAASSSVIVGNTVMYGATGGWLFVHGQAGERFGVRNSGGVAVVEGCGDHGCEYMTNGIVLILGPTGRNFAAGMSGGVAFVLDAVVQKVNTDMVVVQDIERTIEKEFLRTILEAHARLTDSELAAELLGSWNQTLARIKKIHPIPKMEDASADEQDDESLEAKYLQRWKDLFETQPIRIRRQTQSLAFV